MNLEDKWKKMSKSTKIACIASIAGSAILAIPFIVATGPISIVTALCMLGGGTLAAGGFGVAGGIVVTGGGAALSAALAGAIANQVIKDPELLELQKNMSELEKLVAKIQLMAEKSTEKYKDLRERYLKLADFVAQTINTETGKVKKFDRDKLKRNIYDSEQLITDLKKMV